MLNGNLDKTHSVPYQKPSERKYLDSLRKEDPNDRPKISNENDWSQFNNIRTLLVRAPSIFEHVNLLENTICAQGCLFFGTLPQKKKVLSGLNRRANCLLTRLLNLL